MGNMKNCDKDLWERRLNNIYKLLLLAFLIFLGYLFATYRRSIDMGSAKEGFEILSVVSEEKVEDERSPLGYSMEYTYLLPHISVNYRALVFYSSYHNVIVRYDNRDVYLMLGPRKNYMIRTSAHAWNHVIFENEDSNHYVTIRLIPDYEGVATEPEEVYFGELDKINKYYLHEDMPSLVLSIIAVLIGVFFFGYCIINMKNKEIDKNLMMLGLFAVLVGIWKMTDSRALSVLFPNCPTLFMIPFVCLTMATYAFVGYSRYLFQRKDDILWMILEIGLLACSCSILVLQLLGIYEMRQTLILIHISIGVAVLVFCSEIYLEYRSVGINKELKTNMFYIMLCLCGTIGDLVAYYTSQGKSHRMFGGILCFVLYVFAMGYYSLTKAKKLMIEGARAREFERLAYQDPLTGIHNRMAYNHFIGQKNFVLDGLAVAMFDLNDLKKCNDTLGHEKGDVYITNVADALEEIFRGVGNSFRMGGDEFTVLVPNATEEKMDDLLRRVEDFLKELNINCPEIKMQVASGYAIYEPQNDTGIDDISRRADALMYAKKHQIKHSMME